VKLVSAADVHTPPGKPPPPPVSLSKRKGRIPLKLAHITTTLNSEKILTNGNATFNSINNSNGKHNSIPFGLTAPYPALPHNVTAPPPTRNSQFASLKTSNARPQSEMTPKGALKVNLRLQNPNARPQGNHYHRSPQQNGSAMDPARPKSEALPPVTASPAPPKTAVTVSTQTPLGLYDDPRLLTHSRGESRQMNGNRQEGDDQNVDSQQKNDRGQGEISSPRMFPNINGNVSRENSDTRHKQDKKPQDGNHDDEAMSPWQDDAEFHARDSPVNKMQTVPFEFEFEFLV
jgi:hypothetical protein